MNDLAGAAKEWAIENGYWDVFGRWHDADPHALRGLIAALSAGGRAPAAMDTTGGPVHAFQGDGRRLWAISAQLYALRSRRNWGHGDFTDLARLVALAARCGAAGVGLNPLHALFPERPEAASPYAPNSRRFLNVLYIDVEAVPEFPGIAAAGLADDLVALRSAPLIAYDAVGRAKEKGLRLAYEAFRKDAGAARRADFAAFRAELGDALSDFACFEVLRAQYGGQLWKEWPPPWDRPGRAQLMTCRRAHEAECEYHEFLQWTADRQLEACAGEAKRLGLPFGLYLDVAVGIDPNGADAWSRQEVVLTDVSVGAPPDEYNPNGQDWGLAPFNPHALADNDFAPVRELLRAVMRHAGAIRIDHVLGLKRLFLIPHGVSAQGGTYVAFPFHALLRVVAEESNRHRCVVIGEDLGTVPENFREELARWGLWCYRVMMFERDRDGNFLPPQDYPAEALAAFNTHDLPSFRGWLTGHDLREKRAAGIDPGESDNSRAKARAALRDILAAQARDFAPDDFAAVAAFLGATPSRLAAVALEDIAGEVEQMNVPGTTSQHPNWRRKIPVTLEELEKNETLARVAHAFAASGRAIAR